MSQVNLQDKDDGLFWISFSDYANFFYITTICYFYKHLEDNSVCDQHELYGFGLTKFTIDEDITEPVIMSVDQANARFVDETMRGSYEYPALKLMLTKIKESTNQKSGEVVKQQIYLNGNWERDTNVSLPLKKGLKKGEYLLMYCGEFTEEHAERKLVVSVYCGKKIELEKVSTENYPMKNFTKMVKLLE